MKNGKAPIAVLCVLLLALLQVALLLLSRRFAYELPLLDRPYLPLTGLLCLSGAIYLVALFALRDANCSRKLLYLVCAAGLLLRGAAFFSTPMQEDDWHRYLWDGAVTAHGMNPYALAPQSALDALNENSLRPSPVAGLARDAGVILRRVNHPGLRTIYPPVAQAAFAAAYYLAPYRLWSWRLVLFGFDLGIFALLLLLLRQLQLPPAWIAIYWLNPLLLKEIYNSAHMDLLPMFFVLLALLLYLRKKPLSAVISLALAAGAKVWPLLLLPFFLRPFWGRWKKFAAATAIFWLLLALLFYPVLQPEFQLERGIFYRGGTARSASAKMDEQANSGLGRYTDKWEMNDALFMGLVKANEIAGPLHSLLAHIVGDWYWAYAHHYPKQARFDVLIILLMLLVWLNRRPARDDRDFCERLLWICAWLFLLSPTQFPWYFCWLLPLLTLRPRFSLLLYTALLPLYYLRYYFTARGPAAVFDYGIVWLEHLPVLCLLILEWLQSRGKIQFGPPSIQPDRPDAVEAEKSN